MWCSLFHLIHYHDIGDRNLLLWSHIVLIHSDFQTLIRNVHLATSPLLDTGYRSLILGLQVFRWWTEPGRLCDQRLPCVHYWRARHSDRGHCVTRVKLRSKRLFSIQSYAHCLFARAFLGHDRQCKRSLLICHHNFIYCSLNDWDHSIFTTDETHRVTSTLEHFTLFVFLNAFCCKVNLLFE